MIPRFDVTVNGEGLLRRPALEAVEPFWYAVRRCLWGGADAVDGRDRVLRGPDTATVLAGFVLVLWLMAAAGAEEVELVGPSAPAARIGLPASSAGHPDARRTEPEPASAGQAPAFGPGVQVAVPAREPWTDTSIDLPQAGWLHLEASGEVEVAGPEEFGWDWTRRVGPQGTYDWPRSTEWADWPLPTAARGPAPAFALIGKVGPDGEPFLVGRGGTWRMGQAGRLFLGLNDFRAEGRKRTGKGAFSITIATAPASGPAGAAEVGPTKPPAPSPEALSQRERDRVRGEAGEPDPRPWWPAEEPLPKPEAAGPRRVLAIYVDGVPYRALKEMAFAGYLPTVKRLFFEGGLECANTFTLFPSSTLPSNGSFQTGRFSSRHGLKDNVQFDRKSQEVTSYLRIFSPPATHGYVTHQGRWDPAAELGAAWLQSFGSQEAFRLAARRSLAGAPTLAERCSWAGVTYRAAPLPLYPLLAGRGYERAAANSVPPLGGHLLEFEIDEIMNRYALDYVVRPENGVMLLWFPGPDVSGHTSPRGPFGTSRRYLARLDRALATIAKTVEERGMAQDTTWVLFADHGREGGEEATLQGFDLAAEFFYPEAKDEDADSELDPGSGFGFNLLKHGYGPEHPPLTHPGTNSQDAAYVQPMGIAQVYLPVGAKCSRDWSRPNTYYELTHYQLEANLKPVNLLDRVLSLKVPERNRFPDLAPDTPVEFLLVPLGEGRALVVSVDGSRAVIERWADGECRTYRYLPVKDVVGSPEGTVTWEEADATRGDPFGYFQDPRLLLPPGANRENWLQQPHDARTWLRATMYTEYAMAVVTVAEHFAYEGALARLRDRSIPDFVVTPGRGWELDTHLGNTTEHGGLRRASTHVPFLLSGPGIPRGYRLDEPMLLIDLTPTILAQAGAPFGDEDFDGRSLWDVIGSAARPVPVGHPHPRPPSAGTRLPVGEGKGDGATGGVAWWRGREEAMPAEVASVPPPLSDGYRPYTASAQTWRERPVLHDNRDPFDLHNIAFDLYALTRLEVVDVADGVFDIVAPGPPAKPVDGALAAGGAGVWGARREGGYLGTRFEQLLWALKLRQVEVQDVFFPLSDGNLERLGGVVDWLQQGLDDADRAVSRPFSRRPLPPATGHPKEGAERSDSGDSPQKNEAPHILGTPILNGVVDLGQGAVDLTVATVSSLVRQAVDAVLYGLEAIGGALVQPFAGPPKEAGTERGAPPARRLH
jgi:arylsulfatase A-like enzyme